MPEKKPRIFYIDLFRKVNSNLYWLKAFKKYTETHSFDIREDINTLEPRLRACMPNHVHLGGSVKNGLVDPALLAETKDELGCTISVFYGDASYSAYHCELAEVVDFVYINNQTHIKKNMALGYNNFHYLPCPTDPEVFRPIEGKKRYDLLFIGNNNSNSRLGLLKRIGARFNLAVAGRGWKGVPFNLLPEVYGEDFSILVGQAKISLGLIDDAWVMLEACFSNRLVNTLACGAFFIQRYTPGLESMFQNHEHLIWYHNENEIMSLIHHYLSLPVERARIGDQGRKVVLDNFTYDLAVKRIVEDSHSKNG